MVKEPPLYSTESVRCPDDAVRLVREMLQQYDREALVIVNFDSRAKPINLNIVSVGTLNASMAHPREIMKSAVLSNKEVEAESVAYTVCQHYGIETSDYSFAYVAGWSSDHNYEELRTSLETIRSTADELITSIDAHFEKAREEMKEAGIYDTADKIAALKKKKHQKPER